MTFRATAERLALRTMRVLGNDVVIGGITGRGILREPADELFDGMVISTGYQLEIPVAVFGVVLEGMEVVVDDVTFRARQDARSVGDGATMMVPLEKGPADALEYILNGDWA